jgi:enterochelin esterase-like enzyme
MRLRVYLPPLYGEFKMRYPVVYLLHPWGENERYWTDWLGFHTLADHLANIGIVAPFIAVMPQGDKSYFVDAADPQGDYDSVVALDAEYYAGALEGSGKYGEHLIEDVIKMVDKTFQTRAERAGRSIAGISMGGLGAAVLAFTHPELFGAVGVHSPALNAGPGQGPPWIFGLSDPEAFARLDPTSLVARIPINDSPRIYLDCGVDDMYAELVDDLHWALSDRKIQHTFISRPGAHTGGYWKNNLAEYIGFYAGGW